MDSKERWALFVRRTLIPASILLVLFVVAAYRFSQLTEKTREGTTIGRLNELRQAILMYYQDHNGVFPRELTTSGPFGRYLPDIPSVDQLHPQNGAPSPAGGGVTYGTGLPEGFGQGWYYNFESGQIFVNSVGKDSRGIPYTTY